MDTALLDRFWSKVDVSGECWLWTAGCHPFGYGRFRLDGEARLAHRVSYELLVGPIPVGLTLDHLCRRPPCVNPAHLEPVTNSENVRRALAVNYFDRPTCSKGHAWTAKNTAYWGKNQKRFCKTCHREGERQRQHALGVHPRPTETCHRGHPRTSENWRTYPNGKGQCVPCAKWRQQQRSGRTS